MMYADIFQFKSCGNIPNEEDANTGNSDDGYEDDMVMKQ